MRRRAPRVMAGKREADPWIAFSFALVLLVLAFSQIHQSLFGDELYAYRDIAHSGFREVLSHVNSGLEASPPLYFEMAWATAKLGDPTVWLRLPSILLGSATVPLIYLIGCETVGRRAGAVGAAIFALNPFTVFYTVQARPFAATAFFVAASTWALLRAVDTNRSVWWGVYAVASSAAAYCHYTCIFVLVAQGAWSLWVCRDRLRGPVLAAAAAAVLYAPWLPFVRARNVGLFASLYPLTADHVGDDLMRLVAGDPLAPISAIPTRAGIAIIAGCVLVGLVSLGAGIGRQRPGGVDWAQSRVVLVCIMAVGSPVGILLYSLLAADLWSTTSIYTSTPAASLLLGAILVTIPRPVNLIAIAAVIGVLTFGLVRASSSQWQRPPYRAVATYLNQSVTSNEPVALDILFGAPDVEILLHRALRVVGDNPWPLVGSGGRVVVVTPGNRPSAPTGFRLLASRLFPSHVVPTTVWTYKRG